MNEEEPSTPPTTLDQPVGVVLAQEAQAAQHGLSVSQVSSAKRLFDAWLGLDLRSLAAMRMCYGLIIILDILIRVTDLTAHYTDWGACPRNMVLELNWLPEYWSIHMMNGSWLFMFVLFLFHLACATALLIGYRTRLATALCWAMMVSLQNRNPMILDGGDIYQRVILFWAIFIPWHRRWALDCFSKQQPPERSASGQLWFGPGALAYLCQMTLLYVYAGILKTDPVWTRDYTAVYSALCLEQLTTTRAPLLLEHPELMKWLTWYTIKFELFGPILLWIPGPIRLLGALGISSLHLGFGTFMHLGVFALTGILTPVGFFPSFVWNYLARPAFVQGWRATLISTIEKKLDSGWRQRLYPDRLTWGGSANAHLAKLCQFGLGQWVVVGSLLWLCFLWNRTTVPGSGVQMGYSIHLMRIFRLDQQWNMFAPRPLEEDGWYVIDATRVNDTHFDLFGAIWGESPELTWQKPNHVASTYPNARWRKLMMNYWARDNSAWRLGLGRYLTRRWNTSHVGSEQISTFRIYFMREDTDMTGANQPSTHGKVKDPVKVELWSHVCFDQNTPPPQPQSPSPIPPTPSLVNSTKGPSNSSAINASISNSVSNISSSGGNLTTNSTVNGNTAQNSSLNTQSPAPSQSPVHNR